MSERFTVYELIAAIEWMFQGVATCNAAHVTDRETNIEMDRWCTSRHGRMALFTYPPLPGEDGQRFGLNGQWCRLGQTFYFREPDDAFEFRMRWG